MLCWQPVTQDCAGGLETMGTYRHEYAYVHIVGLQDCGAGDGSLCPVYAVSPFQPVGQTADPCLPFDPADPAIGEILLLRVTAIDAAGNEDCGD
jgi:hypothetical protein